MVSILDEHIFGDLEGFRSQYSRLTDPTSFTSLKQRIAPVCKRTLRQQVQAYVSYTQRIPLVQTFTPSSEEKVLYSLVSEYLRRPELNALPSGQRQLISMVMWKLLASSSFAIAGALDSIVTRLESTLANFDPDDQRVIDDIREDYEALDETAEDWLEQETGLSCKEKQSILDEIEELKCYKTLAENIRQNSKGEALLNPSLTVVGWLQWVSGRNSPDSGRFS